MNRKLVLGLALALILISGNFAGALADCGCLPHISVPSCDSCGSTGPSARDLDRSEATCQGAHNYGPALPWWTMGAPSI
jgi:hypothetical protein